MPPNPTLAGRAAGLRLRRGAGELATLAPKTLRGLVRGNEVWLVLLAALLGLGAGLLVVAMNQTTQWAHEWLFALPPGQRLSGQSHLVAWRAVGVPVPVADWRWGCSLWRWRAGGHPAPWTLSRPTRCMAARCR